MIRVAFLVSAVSAALFSAPSTGQWARFEGSVENRRSYGDPFRDVTLAVEFRGPRNAHFVIDGFHDGGTTWRFRFMPDRLGEWKYTAKFSDGSPGALGEFTCVRSDVPGMLATDEVNPVWFGFRGGKQVLIRSLHVGDRFFAQNWPGEKRRVFLDWAQRQGYNMLSIASHYLNRDAPERGRGWETPRLWPLDPAEYRKMEAILDDLARRKMMVFPFAGFFGQKSNYPREAADQELYIRYTLARIGAYWNILLNTAGPEPNLAKSWMADADVQRLGRLIKKADPYGHPISVHNRTGDDPYRDSDWTTYGILQGPKTPDRRKLSRGLLANHHPAKPLYAQETLWAGNTYHREPYTDTDLRKNAFVIMMSGAALNFGDMQGDSSSGFSGTMELADRIQRRHDIVKRVWDYFETVPFRSTRPRQDLVSAGYCLADEGKLYLVYLEQSQPVNVRVDTRVGPYSVRWVSASDPSISRTATPTYEGKALQPPSGGDDWMLELRASTRR